MGKRTWIDSDIWDDTEDLDTNSRHFYLYLLTNARRNIAGYYEVNIRHFASDLGITPVSDGKVIRISFPPLTEERRKQLAKQCGKEAEQAKVSIRNARRDTNDKLKKAIKDGLPEDMEKDGEESLQRIHDKFIKKTEELFAAKEKEIMTV